MPIVLGGDHSIGFPTIRGLAPYMDGNVGIIHFDRHVDTQESDLDERMHTTPWFHATNIKNAPATNLVQIGIGGWQSPRAGVKVGRERQSTVITVGDVERVGVEKIAEMALEIAWKDAKAVYLSFDIDVIDAGFVPGTGWPEPGGLLPREALNLVKMVSEPGLAGIEVVECSPPYDWAEQTALMSSRVILDSLAAQVRSGKLGNKAAAQDRSPGGRDGGSTLEPCESRWRRSRAAPNRGQPRLVEDYTRRAADAGASLVLFPEATMCRFGVPLAPVAEPLDGPWADGVRAHRGGRRRHRRRRDVRARRRRAGHQHADRGGPERRRPLRQDPPLRRVRVHRVPHRRTGPRARRAHRRRRVASG